jgi:ferredoxin
MKVKIDYNLCMGDGNCRKVCPEIFEYDDEHTESHIRISDVPKNLEDLVRKAARECDTEAIIIEE